MPCTLDEHMFASQVIPCLPARATIGTVRLRFGPDDEQEFFAAREELLERFGAWCDTEKTTGVDVDDAHLLLDWKWGYADGDLGHWRRTDVDEFLLEHCPRKVSGPPDVLATIPASVAAFARFLGATGLLAPGSDTAPELADRALAQTRAFEDAMQDDSRFGMAKSLFSRMGLDVDDDLPDADELAAAMERFNSLSFEERGAILGDYPIGRFGPDADEELDGPPLPYRAAPSDADVAASAAAAPVLATLDRLHDHLGTTGVKLTKAGNVTLADARLLVDLLGTGDRIDVEIDGRVFKTRTAAQLPALDGILELAKECRTVRKQGGRLVAVAAWPRNNPIARCERVVEALDAIGMHGVWRPYRFPAFRDLDEILDSAWPHVVASAWIADEPVDVDVLIDNITDACAGVRRSHRGRSSARAGGCRCRGRSRRRAAFARARRRDPAQRCQRRRERAPREEERRHRRAHTARRRVLAVPYLRRAGYEVTVAAELVELDADALLDALGGVVDGGDDVAASWFAAHDEARPSMTWLQPWRRVDDPRRTATGLHLLRSGRASAEAAVRRLLDGPLQSQAWLWLVTTGFEDRASIDPRHIVAADVDTWLGILRNGEPADCDRVACWGSARAPSCVNALDGVAGSDHPGAGELLEIVGRHHPDKATAKHARKAAHRWRSRAL